MKFLFAIAILVLVSGCQFFDSPATVDQVQKDEATGESKVVTILAENYPGLDALIKEGVGQADGTILLPNGDIYHPGVKGLVTQIADGAKTASDLGVPFSNYIYWAFTILATFGAAYGKYKVTKSVPTADIVKIIDIAKDGVKPTSKENEDLGNVIAEILPQSKTSKKLKAAYLKTQPKPAAVA